MKVSEVLRIFVEDGWFLVATKGSHRQFKHRPSRGGSRSQAGQATIWLRDTQQYPEAVRIEEVR